MTVQNANYRSFLLLCQVAQSSQIFESVSLSVTKQGYVSVTIFEKNKIVASASWCEATKSFIDDNAAQNLLTHLNKTML